jgi:hypothetical protein
MVASAQGRDFSSWQKPIIANNIRGLDFVFFRTTNGDGSLTTAPEAGGPVKNGDDLTFAHNWAVAKQVGIRRGAYHFFHPDQSPGQQAQLFVDTVKAHGLVAGDILVNDVEVGGANVDDAALAFCNDMHRLAGPQNPILVYTNQDVGQHLHKTAARYPGLWFAHPAKTAPTTELIAPFKRWVFWQSGGNGADKDAFNGTMEDLTKWIAPFLVPPKAPEPWNEDHLLHLWHLVHTDAADAHQRQLLRLWMDYFAGLAVKPGLGDHEKHVLAFAQDALHMELA